MHFGHWLRKTQSVLVRFRCLLRFNRYVIYRTEDTQGTHLRSLVPSNDWCLVVDDDTCVGFLDRLQHLYRPNYNGLMDALENNMQGRDRKLFMRVYTLYIA